MRQKITIAFSVILLLAAVWLIARDLFHNSEAPIQVGCCSDDIIKLKGFDTTLLGYEKTRVIETGLKNLSGITVNENKTIFISGNGLVSMFGITGLKDGEIRIDSVSGCITVKGDDLLVASGPGIIHYNLKDKSLTKWVNDYENGYITSLAVNDGFAYAADANRKVILKYDLNGKLIQQIGRKDSITDAPGFILPSLYFDIAFGGFNDLWAANTGRLRVEHYTVSGFLQAEWGKESYEPGGFSGCCNPAHLAVLPDGCFVTYEKGIDHIKVFDQTGQFLCFVGGAGSFRGNADFNLGNNQLVKDITTDSDGTIYVLDAYNRINVFSKKKL